MALDAVSATLEPGRVIAVVGENGSGKTTLLRMLARILLPSEGALGPLPESRIYISAQDRQFYEHLTGFENLRFFTHLAGADASRIRDAAGKTGLSSDELDRQIWKYSSGMRVRLLLARLFVSRAPLILLDEPTRSVDLPGREMVRRILREAAGPERIVVFTTHDLETAMDADDVMVLARGRLNHFGPVRSATELRRLCGSAA